ncbi:MAG TPA: hypothetical protein VJ551_00955 [Nitrososphaeraceae archaeon]|nr:hypothetical protein [Nitrososphaeraceae archaeon]
MNLNTFRHCLFTPFCHTEIKLEASAAPPIGAPAALPVPGMTVPTSAPIPAPARVAERTVAAIPASRLPV